MKGTTDEPSDVHHNENIMGAAPSLGKRRADLSRETGLTWLELRTHPFQEALGIVIEILFAPAAAQR